MNDLRRATLREEVAEDFVIARARQRGLNRKAAVGLLSGMDVLKLFEILTDDKQVKWHVVQDVELFDLLFGQRVKDRKAQLDVRASARSLGQALHPHDVFGSLRRRGLDQLHLALRTSASF